MGDFESNYVRSYGRFHCDSTYRDLLLEERESRNEGLVVAEVGAYLGGCTFWAVVHLSGVKAVAVEQWPVAAQAMRQTAKANGIERERLGIVEACVSDDAGSFQI